MLLPVPDDLGGAALLVVSAIFIFWSYTLIPYGLDHPTRPIRNSHTCLGIFFVHATVVFIILGATVLLSPSQIRLWQLLLTMSLGMWGVLSFIYIGRDSDSNRTILP